VSRPVGRQTIRVVMDATSLGAAPGFRGVGRFLRGLLTALADDEGLHLTALATSGTKLPAGVSVHTVRRVAPGRFAPYERDLLLPLSLGRRLGDIAHVPVPEPARWATVPLVQTLFDVIPVSHPDQASSAERRRWRGYAARYRAANAVLAISRFSAGEGLRHLGLDARRLHVAPPAPDVAYRSAGPSEPADPPYLLLVSEYSPRKGFAEAMAVTAQLAERGLPHRLVIAGRIAPWTAETVEGLRRASGRPDRVELAGYVDDLPSLYRGATAVLVTSRNEGYGYPAAEAMASGVPVVAFANSATTEVVAGGGVLVPDGDLDAFTAALRPLLTDAAIRREWAEAAWDRGGQLSWDEAKAVHAAVYRELARA
jgi:glycosyltransferase involved in cell wall biosynthesis